MHACVGMEREKKAEGELFRTKTGNVYDNLLYTLLWYYPQ